MGKRSSKRSSAALTAERRLRIEYLRIVDVVPYDRNPRRHPPEQVDKIAASIRAFGWGAPILVDARNVIVAGHARLAAAVKLGIESVPVVRLGELSEDQRRALTIADNQLTMMGEWDLPLLRQEVGDLKLAGFDLALLGFPEQKLVMFTAGPSAPSQFPEFGEDITTEYCCPRCSYRWSGKPTPEADGDKPRAARNGKART